MTEAFAFFTTVITFAIAVFNEWYSEKARQRQADEVFNKEQLSFNVLAQRVLEKWNRDAAAAAQASQDGQDWLDRSDKPPSE